MGSAWISAQHKLSQLILTIIVKQILNYFYVFTGLSIHTTGQLTSLSQPLQQVLRWGAHPPAVPTVSTVVQNLHFVKCGLVLHVGNQVSHYRQIALENTKMNSKTI